MKLLLCMLSLLLASSAVAQYSGQELTSATSELNVSLVSQGPASEFGLYPCSVEIGHYDFDGTAYIPHDFEGTDKMILTVLNRFSGAIFTEILVINKDNPFKYYNIDPAVFVITDVKLQLNSSIYGTSFKIRKCYNDGNYDGTDPVGSENSSLDATVEVRSGNRQYLFDSQLSAKIYYEYPSYNTDGSFAEFDLLNFQPYSLYTPVRGPRDGVSYEFRENSTKTRDHERRTLEMKLMTTFKELNLGYN